MVTIVLGEKEEEGDCCAILMGERLRKLKKKIEPITIKKKKGRTLTAQSQQPQREKEMALGSTLSIVSR